MEERHSFSDPRPAFDFVDWPCPAPDLPSSSSSSLPDNAGGGDHDGDGENNREGGGGYRSPKLENAAHAGAEGGREPPKGKGGKPGMTRRRRPAWLVDVFRDGVAEPIDTLLIDETTLPPRKNKKGKLIWRLPDDADRLPSFGTIERRRIMELFKERKKERKKAAKKSHSSTQLETDASAASAAVAEESGGTSPAPSCDAASVAAAPNPSSSSSASSKDDDAFVAENKGGGVGSVSKGEVRDGDANESIPTVERGKCGDQKNSGMGTFSAGRPPGFRGSLFGSEIDAETERLAKDVSNASIEELGGNSDDPVDASARPSPPQEHLSPSPAPQEVRAHEPPPPAPPDAQYIVIPEEERPGTIAPAFPHARGTLPPPAPSMAVSAAKAFVDLYYPLLSHGLCDNLARHYTPRAQKSVSVGGAHSVVTGRNDIAMQIAGLAGSVFVVRGVVAQDAHDGRGAHILVTGLVQTPAAMAGSGIGGNSLGAGGEVLGVGVATPFAHSVSLVPATAQGPDHGGGGGIGAEAPFSFQIHNDALSLLGGDVLVAAAVGPGDGAATQLRRDHQTAIQQQGQSHQGRQYIPAPARPPGLFD